MKNKTSNKQIKNVRYRSLGLAKSGAALCFLQVPYLSRYMDGYCYGLNCKV